MSRPLALAGLVALLAACSPAAPPLAGWAGGSFVLTAADDGGATAGEALAGVDAPGADGGSGPRPGPDEAPTPAVAPTASPSPSPSPTATPRRSHGGGSGRRPSPTPTPGPGLGFDVEDGGYADPAAGEAAVVAP